MPQRALGPTLSSISRSKVLPPDPNDRERLDNLIRTQNDKYVPVVDEAMDFITGVPEGLMGEDFNNIKSLRTYRDTGRFVGQALGTIPTELKAIGPSAAVAFGAGKPGALANLRKRGAKTVENILQEGVERRTLGARPKDWLNPVHASKPASDPTIPLAANKELPEDLLNAVSIAQQRWPRLFGHLNEVADVEAMIKLSSGAKGNVTRGTLGGATLPGNPQAYKLGKMGLDPEWANPDTVGHELLHLKDKILNPYEDVEYQINSLVHGYKDNPQEVRARAMGTRFKQIYDKVMTEGGGRARDAAGRNVRVPKNWQKPPTPQKLDKNATWEKVFNELFPGD